MRKHAVLVGILFALIAILVFIRPTVDEVMNDFHMAKNRAEDMLMDPLILHTNLVKNRVIEDIKNPAMDKRRYAIGFLGNERIVEALPVLREILSNEKEKDYMRSDALESIYLINKKEGILLCEKYKDRKDNLGLTARDIVVYKDTDYRVRTKWEALIGSHE